jgi:hypothetical protein
MGRWAAVQDVDEGMRPAEPVAAELSPREGGSPL